MCEMLLYGELLYITIIKIYSLGTLFDTGALWLKG